MNIKDKNDLQIFYSSFIQFSSNLKTKLIKELELMDKENIDATSFSELLSQLNNDQRIAIEIIDRLNLSPSVKEIGQEYVFASIIIDKLNNINFVTLHNLNHSINNGDYPGSSSDEDEDTKLLLKREVEKRDGFAGSSSSNTFFSSTRTRGYGSMESSSGTQVSLKFN